MKHTHLLLLLLVLSLLLSACGEVSQEPYTHSEGGYSFTVDPMNQTITHGSDVYSYTVEDSATGKINYEIFYPDGSIYHWTRDNSIGYGGWSDIEHDEDRYISGDILVGAIPVSQPREKNGSVFYGLILIAMGAANFFLPELPFYLRYGWAVRDAEPSEMYLIITKAGGILVAILGVIVCII